jgi:lactoylglutathione lyase
VAIVRLPATNYSSDNLRLHDLGGWSMRFAILAAISMTLAYGQQVPRPRITGVAHIAFFAHDVDESRAFYTDFLGFQEVFPVKRPDGRLTFTTFKINDRQYVEVLPERQPGTDRLSHIALETDDVAGMLAYLKSRGVKTPPKTGKGLTGNLSFNIKDPDGHTIEFVQYTPESQSVINKGKFMDDRRMATHMSHVGIIVNELEPAMKFYRDILGCEEIWRGSQDGKYLSWVNMRLPDSEDYVEFMLYDESPDLRQLGVLHHIGLLDPDMAEVAARLEAQPGRMAYTRPIEVRGKRRRQIQVYDPDGSRTEAMEPVPADSPLVSSKAPPIR